jgi:hypothetical protein
VLACVGFEQGKALAQLDLVVPEPARAGAFDPFRLNLVLQCIDHALPDHLESLGGKLGGRLTAEQLAERAQGVAVLLQLLVLRPALLFGFLPPGQDQLGDGEP